MAEPEKNMPDYSKAELPGIREEMDDAEDLGADTDDAEVLHFIIPHDCAGLRLDQALAKLLPEYSRSRLQAWVAQQQVQLDGVFPIAKQKVWGGETLEVLPQMHCSEQPYLAEEIALDIVYEDDALMVINKPVGLVVHPGNGNWHGTLLNGLLNYAPQLSDVPRAGIVHRLDKDTSGLMVVAKTPVAQTALVRQLEARSVKREYLALVHGELAHGGTVDLPIGRHSSQRVKMAVVEHGKPAVTHYQVEMKFPGCTLLRCRLETGRTHQIRVHLSHLKFPLVGDSIYIKGVQKCPPQLRAVLNQFPRQALHATRLALDHPSNGALMEWHVAMPHDMGQLLHAIKTVSDESA
jgi:23S rRNA pseudouridine1911/1915/1917 synthase